MKILSLIAALLLSAGLHSQAHYTIKYAAGYIDSAGIFRSHGYNRVLVIERKESYEFTSYNENEKIKEPLGSKFRSHSVYNDMARGISFFQSHIMGYPKYIVEDTITKITWSFKPDVKVIAGFKCKTATATINEVESLVYYSEELPKGFGPYQFTGLPGTVLEIHAKGLPYVISVVGLIKGGYSLQKPDDGKLISYEEYNKILAKVNKNNKRNPGMARKVQQYKTQTAPRVIYRQ